MIQYIRQGCHLLWGIIININITAFTRGDVLKSNNYYPNMAILGGLF